MFYSIHGFEETVVGGEMGSLIRRAINYAKNVTEVVTGRKNAGRDFTVFPEDLFIVSYLRSGSTCPW